MAPDTTHRVRVDGGKYTFVIADGLRVEILRHNEPWHVQEEALNAVHSIMCELDAARVVIAAARKLANDPGGPMSTALRTHAALVSDHEPPSAWAAPPEAPTPAPATRAEKIAALEYARTVLDPTLSRVLDGGLALLTAIQILDDLIAVARSGRGV